MDALAEFRRELNVIDAELVQLLARRFAICRSVAHHKQRHGISMMQPARVAEVKERAALAAAERGMNPDFVRCLYGLIIDEACRLENAIIGHAPEGTATSTPVPTAAG